MNKDRKYKIFATPLALVSLLLVNISFAQLAHAQVPIELHLSAEIVLNEGSDSIRIEADQRKFNSLYIGQGDSGRFADLAIPFRVHSTAGYSLQVQQFYYRCSAQSPVAWEDKSALLEVAFVEPDNNNVAIDLTALVAAEATPVNFPSLSYTTVDSTMENGQTHAFTIAHNDFNPSTDNIYQCRGAIGIIATGGL